MVQDFVREAPSVELRVPGVPGTPPRAEGDGPLDPMTGIQPVERPRGATWTWPVYRTGDAQDPPVIVMHEISGMSPTYIGYCRALAARGFHVWMPHIVGPTPTAGTVRAAVRVCISREIDVLRSGRTSRVVAPLRDLARHVSGLHGGGRVGVVGMCLTGGFALAMATEPAVSGAVAAQPALPFRPFVGRALGLSPADAQAIGERLEDGEVAILCTRFARDALSPHQRCAAVQDLGPGVEIDEIPAAGFSFLDHSVLTVAPGKYRDRQPQAARLQESADRVTDFLRSRLGAVAPNENG
ncbi:dienelactone hydrolase family protein [Cellulomonas terrae]|uniref:Dienelactone hydrolase n=1 Tax=Cellulomonas terrae TaxID=311234 RepID=A0A511JQE3_9CELL|nr:dienelactone hydrolase family protein [Cellulomonas terrae]GEM00197.1 dienelactone hydrolase [Cellulomonas terrae]